MLLVHYSYLRLFDFVLFFILPTDRPDCLAVVSGNNVSIHGCVMCEEFFYPEKIAREITRMKEKREN